MTAMTGDPGMVLAADAARVEVPIRVADPAWKAAGGICATIRRAARAVIRELAATGPEESGRVKSGPVEISVLLTGDAEVRGLNRDYRKVDAATNVLAFASGDPRPAPGAPRLLGDVVLAYGTVRREAEERKLDFSHHLAHLVVHGVLHLLGYDHLAAAEAEAMERAEVQILANLGIGDPYRRGRIGTLSGTPTKER